MSISVPATRDALAAAFVGLATQVSVHSSNPGTTGVAELARVPLTWGAATTTGVRVGTGDISLTAGQTASHGGLWSSGGIFREGGPLDKTYAGPGTFKITVTYTQT